MGIKKIQNTFNKNKGFSLIELLIAMSVMALGMLAAASMQYSAVRNNTTGNTSTQATMLAKATMEMLKNQDIDSTALAVAIMLIPPWLMPAVIPAVFTIGTGTLIHWELPRVASG